MKIRILTQPKQFAIEFERCCGQYQYLHLASAWCGDPNQVLPYSHVESLQGEIKATIGISFNHTHPDSIDYLNNLKADIRIFNDNTDLFHPKIYFFSKNKSIAIFIGSSNFTYSGFYCNVETNMLIEGIAEQFENKEINELKTQMNRWHSDLFSFIPSKKWLKSYRKSFEKSLKTQNRHGIKTPPRIEEEISSASWLRNANWRTYYNKVVSGLKKHNRNGQGYIDVLDSAKNKVPLPWEITYFDDLEKRRIIGGMGDYGWLGHVAAAGNFRKLLSKGSKNDKEIIVSVINLIGSMSTSLPWQQLEIGLNKLVNIGFTMKIWGRLLCIVKPDLFCTVASISVRQNLSKTLNIPQKVFEKPDGYIRLLKLIHASPWYNSSQPKNNEELNIWVRRVAFIDAIFY